jgi:DNA-binding MarR family transcriptional regulator
MNVSQIAALMTRAKKFQNIYSNRKRALTINQVAVLFILEDARLNNLPEINVTKMGALLNCTAANASCVLKRMEEMKLIKRTIKTTGIRGRQHVVPRITRQGTKVIDSFFMS